MKINAKTMPIWLIMTAAVLLALIVFINIANSTLARYTSFFGGEVAFSPNSKAEIQLAQGEWSATEDAGIKEISLKVSKEESQSKQSSVRLRLFVPDADATLPALVLKLDGNEYVASTVKLQKGTAAYKAYGEGQICCFYKTDGNEMCFDLSDASLDVKLIFASEKIDTTGFRVIVEPVNAEKWR